MKNKVIDKLPIIELDRIILRPITMEDCNDLFEYANDNEVSKYLPWTPHKDIEESKNVIRRFLEKPINKNLYVSPAIVYKENNKMIGVCEFVKIDWETLTGSIGYVINRDYWGRGIMTEACGAIIRLGFEYLELEKIVISHLKGNIGSKRVIEKNGFKYIGDKYDEDIQAHVPHYQLNKKDHYII